jgi:hypothetical protein
MDFVANRPTSANLHLGGALFAGWSARKAILSAHENLPQVLQLANLVAQLAVGPLQR